MKKTTRITMEHYRDFIGALAHERAYWNTEIKAMEHALENEEYDWVDGYEYIAAIHEFKSYTRIQAYFMETERWSEFANLELLKMYVMVVDYQYKAIDAYSKAVLPIDGGELVGITQEEWENLKQRRFELRNKMVAWSTFADFCEFGRIL